MGPIQRFFDNFYYIRYELAVLGVLFALTLGLFALRDWDDQERIEPALQRAEASSEEEPQHTRAILDSLSPRFWWYPERQARYGLLYSKALDKSFVDLKSDSLIAPAVMYYATSDHLRYRMLAFYYAGRVYENAQNTLQAHIYFKQADQLADSLKEYQIGGLIARGLANIYNGYANYANVLKYRKKEYENFTQSGSTPHINFSLYSIGDAYNSLNDFEKSLEFSHRALKAYEQSGDSVMCAYCMENITHAHIQLSQISAAKRSLLRVRDEFRQPLNSVWYSNYACVCAYEGLSDSTQYYIKEAEKRLASPIDSLIFFHRSSLIANYFGEDKQALNSYIKSVLISEFHARNVLNAPFETLLSQYYSRMSEDLESQLQRKTRRTNLSIVLFALLFIGCGSFLIYKIRSRERSIKQYISRSEEAITSLRERERELERMNLRINELVADKFSWIDGFANTSFVYQETTKVQHQLYKKIKTNLREFASVDYVCTQILPLIDESTNGMLSRLKKSSSVIRDEDLQLICYLLLGYTSQTICFFLDIEKEPLYNRVTRLKKRIASCGFDQADQLLARIKKGL